MVWEYLWKMQARGSVEMDDTLSKTLSTRLNWGLIRIFHLLSVFWVEQEVS
jgi:hypothetical protein